LAAPVAFTRRHYLPALHVLQVLPLNTPCVMCACINGSDVMVRSFWDAPQELNQVRNDAIPQAVLGVHTPVTGALLVAVHPPNVPLTPCLQQLLVHGGQGRGRVPTWKGGHPTRAHLPGPLRTHACQVSLGVQKQQGLGHGCHAGHVPCLPRDAHGVEEEVSRKAAGCRLRWWGMAGAQEPRDGKLL
jgi:hypothetical protein